MNLYNRPLFMQQGGAARVPMPPPPAGMRPAASPGAMPPMRPAPAPMGAPGAAPRPAAPPMAAPRPTGAPTAEGIASMVSKKAMAQLDQAQGPEQMINAFRGNQKPLEARYQELAQYVGPQDATSTPISVLTMVQPALMMTSKGAAESGIGELMAGVAGKVPMDSAPGQPNRMGQGLGNIMMSRQAPQPAGMAQGGVVGKFAKGGSSLKDYYNEDLATFQEIMAPTQQDRDAAKRQLFFDIAQRGLAMAGGAGGTGNVASQLANVFQTLPGTYAAQQAELRKGEQGARNAALQSAAGRVGADREQAAKTAAKKAELAESSRLRQLENTQQYDLKILELNKKAELEGREVDIKQYISQDGQILSQPYDMNDPVQRKAAQELGETVKGVLISPDKISALLEGGFKALGPNSIEGISTYTGMLSDGKTLGPQQISDFSQNVTNYLNPRTVTRPNQTTGVMESFLEQQKLSPFNLSTINKAIEDGRLPKNFMAAVQSGAQQVVPEVVEPVVPNVTTPDSVVIFPDTVQTTPEDVTKAELLGVTVDPEILATAQQTEDDFLQADYTEVLGTQEGLKKIIGGTAVNILRAFDGLDPVTGPLADSIERSEEEYQLGANLTAFNNGLTTQFYATRTGKAAKDERIEFRILLPVPYKLTEQPQEFVAKYKALLSKFSKAYAEDVSLLNSPLYTSPADTQDLLRSIEINQSAVNDLRAIILGAEKSLNRYSNEITGPPSSVRGNVDAARAAALGNQ